MLSMGNLHMSNWSVRPRGSKTIQSPAFPPGLPPLQDLLFKTLHILVARYREIKLQVNWKALCRIAFKLQATGERKQRNKILFIVNSTYSNTSVRQNVTPCAIVAPLLCGVSQPLPIGSEACSTEEKTHAVRSQFL